MKLIYLSSGNALKKFRKEHFDGQGGICPILKMPIKFEDSVVDHQHMTKRETLGVNGAGLVRGIIHNGANAVEGTIKSIYRRRGLAKIMPLEDYLRNLADYIEKPPLIHLGYVHPNEKPKAEDIGKREFNRLIKYWSKMYPKKKKPVWKDNGRMKKGKKRVSGRMNLTKDIKKWTEEADKLHYDKYK